MDKCSLLPQVLFFNYFPSPQYVHTNIQDEQLLFLYITLHSHWPHLTRTEQQSPSSNMDCTPGWGAISLPTNWVHEYISSLFGQSPHKYIGKGGSTGNNILTTFGKKLLYINIVLERFSASCPGILQILPSELYMWHFPWWFRKRKQHYPCFSCHQWNKKNVDKPTHFQ